MTNDEIIPHLFRTEYRKIVSVLCRKFGFEHMAIAEDIASETFLTAAQTWGVNGPPPNPVAWLHNVARNKASNHLQRDLIFKNKVAPQTAETENSFLEIEIDLSPQNINDSQLQMMFAICHPAIPAESQIGLALRVLCGFGIDEIADAFLVSKETINKRLFRAKEKLREEKIKIELPPDNNLEERLAPVLRTIYLLFNEGYYSVSQNTTVRKELCFEAIRLCSMLIENNTTNKPQVNALLALMCFHASRLEARLDKDNDLILYNEQDTGLWNYDLIGKGAYFLHCAARGNKISKYHLEAGIAYWNTQKADTKEKWENILHLYNQLLQLEYSPIAALNRTYALSKCKTKEEAIVEAEKLNLTDNHFYFMLLGELYNNINPDKAEQHFKTALSIARTESDRVAIQKKIEGIQSKKK
jgi:RNA polymerase sigma factor (sigma-70 family)